MLEELLRPIQSLPQPASHQSNDLLIDGLDEKVNINFGIKLTLLHLSKTGP